MPVDPAGASSLLARLGGLHVVDLVLLGVIVLFGLGGLRRGFVGGVLGLVGLFATVAVALAAAGPLAQWVRAAFPAFPATDTLLRLLAFVVALGLAQMVFSVVVRLVQGALSPVRRSLGPLASADRLLGFLPGAVTGILVIALVITPLRLFPAARPVSDLLDQSTLAREISRLVGDWSPQLEGLLQNVAGNGGVALPSRIIEPGENVQVPRTQDVQPDAEAEARMLDLINVERLRAGLRPLVADERLREVARQHSQEMFRLGYFAHVSPSAGSPADRLQRSGVPFATAGENLAYAPTVEVAHSGLMASPGHRKNILTPEFNRVGIGVMRGGLYGRMFTQNFAG
ncbi:MAG TPA: CvpA family protein [Chloroflexota bacterium]|jgi:uncharacterized protein YkwD/uncharacterized membrane protein required for colicin V production|nr:CvpA family protein [Chloroflexota bacterium]